MLDIHYIRDNLKLCQNAAKHKNRSVDWDRLISADDERRSLIQQIDSLRAQRNKASVQRTKGLEDQGRQLKKKLKILEDKLRMVEEEFKDIMLTVPNIPDASVPIGADSSANKVVKTWGDIPKFSFPPKDHIQLARNLDLIDFERGVKIGGFRSYFLKNEGAQLEFAVLFYTFQKLIAKGYTPLIAPSLVKEFTLVGNGQIPWGRDEVYHIEKDDVYLAGTAEVPVTAYFSGEVLEEKTLPKKFVAFSPCFRREAGSYGKDTKGVYRLHQFSKIEQVIISDNNLNNSFTLHEELLRNSEEILQDLGIPYRVLLMCTGDMGEPQVKKYDVEAWMPGRHPSESFDNTQGVGSGQGGYGETMSNSVMGDFQARRLNIRFRSKDGKINYCHTLNNTAIASPRILIAILENYQQEDGTVNLPKVLVPFVGKHVIQPKDR